jgi:ankyrin repeat protein
MRLTLKHHQKLLPPSSRTETAATSTVTSRSIILLGLLSLLAIGCNKTPENSTGALPQKPVPVVEVATPESDLAKAATRGNFAKVKSLIEAGAKVTVTDALGRTPLHMAAFYSRPKTAAFLIANGANVNAKDRTGMTPLHSAVLVGGEEEVELLLDNKADIKAASETGLTPLHLAAATGQPDLVTLLIERGADPQSKDREENTPFALAAKNNHPKTMALLQQYVSKK